MASTPTNTDNGPPKQVIIAGGGVIGTCTAYYLAHNFGIACTIVDSSGTIAPAASGKAGGFLALDWNDMSPLRQLTRRSYHLHQELANAVGADRIQYRRLTCASIGVDPAGQQRRPIGKKFDNIEWARKENVSFQMLGDTDTIAQVHPKKLCQALWDASCATIQDSDNPHKNQLLQGKVTSISDEDGKAKATLQDGTTLTADAVLLACGPWTANIMTGIKYHSVVIPTDKVLNQCVFFVGCGDPEVYVRPDSTAYCTGFPDPAAPVTEKPGQEEVRSEAVNRIVKAVREASGDQALSQEPSLAQACYLPSTPDGLPIMGKLPGADHCYVAAGHTCWGILLGPATGETMANLIATGATSTDHVSLGPFQPARFRNFQPLVEHF
jgi:glycine/D-amino acid oxidase-like deaminating enzyme